MIRKMRTLHNMVPELDFSLAGDYQSHCRPQRSLSFTRHPKLLLILVLSLVVPSSTFAVRTKNCSMAEARHSARDDGNPVLYRQAQVTLAQWRSPQV
jgi:hypothetical protein